MQQFHALNYLFPFIFGHNIHLAVATNPDGPIPILSKLYCWRNFCE